MKKNQYANEYLFAFTQTVPILLGYIFLGIAFGLMLQDAGYNFIWAFFMSIFVYAGSMQFMLVTLLAGAQSLINTFVMTLFINGRIFFTVCPLLKNSGRWEKHSLIWHFL